MITKNIVVHRRGEHVATIPCDPGAPGWIAAADTVPFTIEAGDRLDLAVTEVGAGSSPAALTPKQRIVLAELDELSRGPKWAVETNEGWWLPYHVRNFRGTGLTGRPETMSLAREAKLSVDACAMHLRTLAGLGLADARKQPGMRVLYKINDAGRRALERGEAC